LLGVQGVALRLPTTGTQLAAQLSVEGSAGGEISSIAALFNQTIAAKKALPIGNLFAPESSHTGRFAWSAAQAIGPHASAQAWLGWSASWVASGTEPTRHIVDVTGGFMLTVDAAPRVPLAVCVEYDGDAIVSGSLAPRSSPSEMLADQGASSFLTGVFYTGRRDLQLGVLGGSETRGAGPARSSAQGRLELGYFF
jgi:hypothetical protein